MNTAFISAMVLAIVHLTASRFRFLHGTPRSCWLSVAAGVSVAYVFLHLLPEVVRAHQQLSENAGILAKHPFLITLVGLVFFYGVERAARKLRRKEKEEEGERNATAVFWLHVVSFSVYNSAVGYLIGADEIQSQARYIVALALHFIVVDYGLEQDHHQRYARYGRWILCTAIVGGFLLGASIEPTGVAIELIMAFLAGGITLNVLKEELPPERESRYGAFLLGCAGYSALILLT